MQASCITRNPKRPVEPLDSSQHPLVDVVSTSIASYTEMFLQFTCNQVWVNMTISDKSIWHICTAIFNASKSLFLTLPCKIQHAQRSPNLLPRRHPSLPLRPPRNLLRRNRSPIQHPSGLNHEANQHIMRSHVPACAADYECGESIAR